MNVEIICHRTSPDIKKVSHYTLLMVDKMLCFKLDGCTKIYGIMIDSRFMEGCNKELVTSYIDDILSWKKYTQESVL